MEELRVKIKFFLRNIFRNNAFFYTIYSIYRIRFFKENRSFVVANTSFCVEGFPSSANTYFQFIMGYLFPELVFAHHTHTIATVKKSLKRGLPTIILIRNPIDAIASKIIRFEDDLESSYTEYIKFYSYVEKNIDKLFILSFEEVIENDFTRLFFYLDNTGKKYDKKMIFDASLYSEKMTELLHGGSKKTPLPSSEKELMKIKIIESVKNSKKIKSATFLYNKIMKVSHRR